MFEHDITAHSVEQYFRQHEQKPLVRLITCGSVDDGKSTLIGRLLYDSKLILDDQMAALGRDSKRFGTQNGALDFALLVDGLQAEREQGITIDVAYRFFDTAKRKFILADCPGHAQYTRNMATGASTADVAIVLVDAQKGLLEQTRRHSFIAALLGIRHVVLAVNKMDLVDFQQARFQAIVADYQALAQQLGITQVQSIPVCALLGDNLTQLSSKMPWYLGASLLETLENILPNEANQQSLFQMPVQWVSRPNAGFRGYAGTIAQGHISVGDAVGFLPSNKRSTVSQILCAGTPQFSAQVGEAVTLCLADEQDMSRGDCIVGLPEPSLDAGTAGLTLSDRLVAHVLWMHEAPLEIGRSYLLKLATKTVAARVVEIQHQLDINTQAKLSLAHLGLNEIASCVLQLDQAIACTSFAKSGYAAAFASFILIDRLDNATVAAGTVATPQAPAKTVVWHAHTVNRALRAQHLGQTPRCLWFTGLSGAGKSTLASAVEQGLQQQGLHTYLLDGDNLRHGLNQDLDFSDAGRSENVRRMAAVAGLMVDAGLVVLVSCISPMQAERDAARALIAQAGVEFVEIFVDTPLILAEARDVKGLYAKARAGQIQNFTGIDAPYELPKKPELHLHTADQTVDALAQQVLQYLKVG
jgi:bifunctional enzyme CysN/CysC